MRKVNKYERGQLIMGFIDVIKEKARADKKTIVLPESEDRRVLEATADNFERRIGECGFDR